MTIATSPSRISSPSSLMRPTLMQCGKATRAAHGKARAILAEYGVSEYDASLLVPNHDMADYFESVARASGASKLAANWILGDLSAALNRHELSITEVLSQLNASAAWSAGRGRHSIQQIGQAGF